VRAAAEHKDVNLRKARPLLYGFIMTFAGIRIGLAINFWTSKPAFHPYDIPNSLIALVFFLLGLWQVIFLNVWRDLRKVRVVLALSAAVTLAWGLLNTHQFFFGPASLQLPIVFIGLAVLQLLCVFSLTINSGTERP
jgi:hypothetical protein